MIFSKGILLLRLVLLFSVTETFGKQTATIHEAGGLPAGVVVNEGPVKDNANNNNDLEKKHPQYAFAHRVNDENNIKSALDAEVSGIECDVSWSSQHGGTWIVRHDTPNVPWAGPPLDVWLERLKVLLDTNQYNETFSALWLDIKSPNVDDSLYNVMESVHRVFADPDFAVIYDLNDPKNILLSSTGYDFIKYSLQDNEGVGVWLKKNEEHYVPALMAKFEKDNITRSTVSHGHSIRIDKETIKGINLRNDQRNPYHFKKVFTWTTSWQSAMELYINPDQGYRTDGQIIGSVLMEWNDCLASESLAFKRAVKKYSFTQRMAHPSDSFWSVSPKQNLKFQPIQLITNPATGLPNLPSNSRTNLAEKYMIYVGAGSLFLLIIRVIRAPFSRWIK